MPADSFTAIDLSRLPVPPIIEVLSFEAIYAAAKAQLLLYLPDFDTTLESEPVVKLLQVFCYREMLLRQRINDAAAGMMLAKARAGDLDHLGALMNVPRLEITPADTESGTPAIMESDEDFRRRIQIAPEGFSVAGPRGAYVFHALSAHPDVLDADASSPVPGEVVITVLSRTGTGAAPTETLDAVTAALAESEDVRPMTDDVSVVSAEIVNYAILAEVFTYAGPDASVVLGEGTARLNAYVAAMHKIGLDVNRSAIVAALHVEGVQRVVLTVPAANVAISRTQASHCTGVTVTHGGVAE